MVSVGCWAPLYLNCDHMLKYKVEALWCTGNFDHSFINISFLLGHVHLNTLPWLLPYRTNYDNYIPSCSWALLFLKKTEIIAPLKSTYFFLHHLNDRKIYGNDNPCLRFKPLKCSTIVRCLTVNREGYWKCLFPEWSGQWGILSMKLKDSTLRPNLY